MHLGSGPLIVGAVRLLLINQFYPPDAAPTGRVLHALAHALVERGHEVHALASRACYAASTAALPPVQACDGVTVRRVGGAGLAARGGLARRVWEASGFLARVAAGASGSARPDVVISLTSPPFVGWAAAHLARRAGARLVHWVMDAYPDALVAHGLVRPGRPAHAWARAVARRAYASASLVVTLGPFMAQRVQALLPDGARLEHLPLWGEPPAPHGIAELLAARRALGWDDAELVLLYAGNLGRGHRVGEFLEAARRLGARGPRFVFAGGGVRRLEVERFAAAHPAARVQLLPYAGDLAHGIRLAAADVHLASLRTEWQGVIAPSKVQAAFAAARPLLFVGPPDNEAAAWVRASGGGWCVAEDDVEGLLRALVEAGEAGERARRAAAARAYSRTHFDRERNLAQLVQWITQTTG